MRIAHLLASPFYGGPERQMLGLARHLDAATTSIFLTFAEHGKCQAFLDQVHLHGFEGQALTNNTPHFRAAANEVARESRRLKIDLLTCSGYKPDLIGWWAARQVGIPVVAVAHGWTAATRKVRFYESLDRLVMRRMNAVVCVSEAQAERVRRARIAEEKIVVIRNAVAAEAFAERDPAYGQALAGFFATKPRYIIGAAGRLSKEKGFDQLVAAAAIVLAEKHDVAFIHFGDGPLRQALGEQIEATGLSARFILAGFRSDVAKFLPHLELVVLPSYTEGLPVVLLEAFAAGVPAVATAVGGTPEVITDGTNGYLVPPGDPAALAARILDALRDEPARVAMGIHGRQTVRDHFTFAEQSTRYQALFNRLVQIDSSRVGQAYSR